MWCDGEVPLGRVHGSIYTTERNILTNIMNGVIRYGNGTRRKNQWCAVE